VLAAPSSTTEEFYLLAQIARALGTGNIDHRLRQTDFSNQAAAPAPGLQVPIAAVEDLQGVLVVGCNLRHEMPLLAHRVRKAALKGAKVAFLNPRQHEYLFPVAAYGVADMDLVGHLGAVLHAAAATAGTPLTVDVPSVPVGDSHRALAAALLTGERRTLILGQLAQRHPAYGRLQVVAGLLAKIAGASLSLLTEGANAAGAHVAGVVPHRLPGGRPVAAPGLAAGAMLAARLKAYVLFGGIDPDLDLAGEVEALDTAELVIAATTHLPDALKSRAHVVLPIGSFAETAGTFVNIEGRWQSWQGAAKLVGDSRPGWKVLRVLANLLDVPGIDYASAEEVLSALKSVAAPSSPAPPALAGAPTAVPPPGDGVPVPVPVPVLSRPSDDAAASAAWIDVPPYQGDVLVRGSEALAKTRDGQLARVVL
jgi:NADH-quinone oxidoreductase subunit G